MKKDHLLCTDLGVGAYHRIVSNWIFPASSEVISPSAVEVLGFGFGDLPYEPERRGGGDGYSRVSDGRYRVPTEKVRARQGKKEWQVESL